MKKNNKLVLVGGGGHCKSVLDAAIRANYFSEIVITDCSIPVNTKILGCKVVGNDEVLPKLFEKGFKWAFITIGSIKATDIRRSVFLKTQKIGFCFPTIIDPSAVVSASALIGKGVYIGKNTIVNADVVINDMVIINTAAIIEHDCKIGDFTHIAVGATVCGGTEIESDVFVGANATIVQGVKIGMKSVVGAGSIVLDNVPEYSRVVGTMRINR